MILGKPKTRLDILLLNQEVIFQEVLGFSPDFDKKYTNPLRIDNNPGCSFFTRADGVIIFTDWARRDLSGDALRMKYIASKNNLTPRKVKTVTHTKSSLDIKCTYRKEFSQEFITYFAKANIDITLERHRVKEVSRIFINDSCEAPKDLSICYLFDEGIKIYRPHNEWKKWTCTTKSDQVWGFVPDQDEYCLISSSKDSLTMKHNLGICSPCGMSEVVINYDLLDYLKDRNTTVLFDPDETGIREAKRLHDLFGFRVVFLSKKDPYDLVTYHNELGGSGKEKLRHEYYSNNSDYPVEHNTDFSLPF